MSLMVSWIDLFIVALLLGAGGSILRAARRHAAASEGRWSGDKAFVVAASLGSLSIVLTFLLLSFSVLLTTLVERAK